MHQSRKTTRLFTAALAISCGAMAQGGPPGAKAEKAPATKQDKSPIVGTYVSTNVVEFINGTPCQEILHAGFVLTWNSSQMVTVSSDGNVFPFDNNASRSPRSNAVGVWSADARQVRSAKTVTILFDGYSRVSGYDIVESQAEMFSNFSGSSGAFEARTCAANQDPFDENETPQFVNTGSFVSRRVN